MGAIGQGPNGAEGGGGAPDAGRTTKTKTGGGARKGRAKASAHQTEVAVGDAHVDMVRLVRSERKAEFGEDEGPVQLSKVGKAPQLTLSEGNTVVTGVKGFRSVRATHGVHCGTWYCEVAVTHLGATGHARMGWATKKAELQAPVGFDEHGFGFRDLEGSKVHQGKREPYGMEGGGFTEGDVVGMLLHMPHGGRAIEVRKRKVVKFKGALYYEEEPEVLAKPLPGAAVHFFVNGQHQGAAYTDMPEGTYYPIISLYTMPEQTEGATATVNFGPNFAFPLPAVEGLPAPRAMCEVAAELQAATAAEAAEAAEAAGGDAAAGAEPAVAVAGAAAAVATA
ncbi:hypothetical protein FOA52_004569 [Chlamydomonas sp. UWO 241]|nr:hypothetical protein FOA52_004569 [Chlamydomonas sp. UWO 241]